MLSPAFESNMTALLAWLLTVIVIVPTKIAGPPLLYSTRIFIASELDNLKI